MTNTTHLLAVDRCYQRADRQAALSYARTRLVDIEHRLVHRAEVEAAVVTCPLGSCCTRRLERVTNRRAA